MIQMGKSMPCLYEQMAAVPAMASAQQSGNSNNSSNNSSNNNSNNNVSQSYEEMLGGSSGAGGMSLVPQGGASGQFPTRSKSLGRSTRWPTIRGRGCSRATSAAQSS